MAKEFQFKRADAARWTSVNPILKRGEPGIEIETGSSNIKMKYGDGIHNWNDLPYFGGENTGIEIPSLILSKKSGVLNAKWNSFNTEFLNYNPRIRLFRYSKNSKRNKILRPYFNRPSSLKMRMITKLAEGVTKTLQWDCPEELNEAVEIDIDCNDWVYDWYVEGDYKGVYMTRKSRQKLHMVLIPTDSTEQFAGQISISFGLGIVIDNPNPENGLSCIFGPVTKFRIGAQREHDAITNDPIIRKLIRLV